VYNTRGYKYSLDAPGDEQKYLSKHVEQPRNNKLSYTVTSCWSFSYISENLAKQIRGFPMLIKRHTIKAYGEVEAYLHHLDSR
jgi:hypothetical protein